jgi:hypothetical protein
MARKARRFELVERQLADSMRFCDICRRTNSRFDFISSMWPDGADDKTQPGSE